MHKLQQPTAVAKTHSLGMQRCVRNELQRSRLRSRLLRHVCVLSRIICTPDMATCKHL